MTNNIRIAIGLIVMIITLYVGSTIIEATKETKSVSSQYSPEYVEPVTIVDPEPEFNVELQCPEYRSKMSSGEYEYIPGLCFEYFHITDAMMEARFRAMHPYENPCSN